jgi:hypothetical protein
MLGTVAVASRRAYSLPSAGTMSAVCPAMTQPIRSTWAPISAGDRDTRKPGIDSSLSSVPPVWPRPRPDSFTTASPSAAARGPNTSDTPSLTPPVECLSTLGIETPSKGSVAPESTIAAVSAAVSETDSPRM